MDWLTNRWWKRVLIFVTAPVWGPLLLALSAVIVAAFYLVYIAARLTWIPLLGLVSWIVWGDVYVLGNWWTVFVDPNDTHYHEEKVREARRKAFPPKPVVESKFDQRRGYRG